MPQTPNLSLWLVEEGATTVRQLYNDNFASLDTALGSNHDHVHNHVPPELVGGVTDSGATNYSTDGVNPNEDVMEIGSSAVYLDGLRLVLTTHYTEDSGDYQGITLNNPPPNGMTLIMDYEIAV